MSSICYDEDLPKKGGFVDYYSADATKFYLSHYSNRLLLQFIANNPLATFPEKTQARKELIICDRKLEYWGKHPNFSMQKAEAEIVRMKKEWSTERR